MEREEMRYVCDAQIMKDKRFKFNWLKFIIEDKEYSRMLQDLPAGHFVEVYIKLK